MATYTDVNGTAFTDKDIERWAAPDEAGEAYAGRHLGPPTAGRPISVGVNAKPFTLRLDVDRRAKLEAHARERNTTPSQVLRELIDAM